MRLLPKAAEATLLILLPLGLILAQVQSTTAKKKATTSGTPTAQKKTGPPAAAKSTATAKSTTKRKYYGTRKGTATKAASNPNRLPAASRQTWRTRQLSPTPERYKEIQQALISKGYLQGEPTGTWGPDSVEALKRFQQDQKIETTGKINSLSLIALGLGPKRETATAVKPPAPPAQEDQPAPPSPAAAN
jgi:hypothetical protein